MRHIYLSPHLDDAVYSCGGLIASQARLGQAVEIWTVSAGDPPEGPLSPFAEMLHASWGLGREAPATRRREDIAACLLVGAAHRHFSFVDCIYRRAPDGTWLYNPDNMWSAPLVDDEPVIETLRATLDLLLHPDDRLYCPLTVGGHVDHRLARLAAERLGRPLLHFADYPYVQNQEVGNLSDGLALEVHPLSPECLRLWQDGVAVYASQLSAFWPDEAGMRKVIAAYASPGLRLWMSG